MNDIKTLKSSQFDAKSNASLSTGVQDLSSTFIGLKDFKDPFSDVKKALL